MIFGFIILIKLKSCIFAATLIKLIYNMLSTKLHEALNAQINAEFWSAYLYLSMSLDAEAKGLKGVANWFYIQFREEQDHARIFMNYVVSRDAKVDLKPIAEVCTTWNSPLDMFKDTLEHEKKVTAMINNLAAIATSDNDYASSNTLVWFINEQVEEESNARDMIAAFDAVEGNKFGLYMLDKELATRVYTEAAPLTQNN
jgi:ferritin